MINLTLKQLRYAEALAPHGHFGRAAAACAISQPALSMQISALEAALAAPLFERGPQGVQLTPFGALFLPRAALVLRGAEALGDLARGAVGGLGLRLALGVIPTIAPYILPRLMGRMFHAFPALELHLRETMTPRLVAELIEGRLDAALVALPIGHAALAELPLFAEDFLLVRARADADLPVPNPEHLREMRLLLLEDGHCFRDQALAFCALSPSHPREVMDGSSLTTLVQMVAAGMGVTLIPEMAAPIEARAADVALARFAAPAPQRRLGLIWRKSSPIAAEMAALGREIIAARPGSIAP